MHNPTQSKSMSEYSVLVVDLDHSLIATDTLLESLFLLLKSQPLNFFLLFGWLLKGKSYFKDQLAQRVCPKTSSLPYRREVLEYIAREKSSGKSVILATASHHQIARSVANHLGLFSDVLASDVNTNLSGKRKLDAVLAATKGKSFAYIGDAYVDIPLWKAADTAVLIDPSAKLLRRLRGHRRVDIIRSRQRVGRLRTWIKALRLHQWAKNLLVFLPAIMAHRIFEPAIILHLSLAFLLLSLSASSVYLLNDLLDLEADRQHPRKRKRPLASGVFSIKMAIYCIPIFLILSYSIALSTLPLPFFFALVLYLLLTSLYSFALKQKIIIDVILLASLYTFRVIAGAIAVSILVSSWLLAFSMFFFLSLALMKRYSELLMMHEDIDQIPGRGYVRFDAETTLASGIASGQLSLLVFALFMNDAGMREIYGRPTWLWFVLPVLFYWITRMWMLAHRGEMREDPIVFTIKDRASYVALVIIILIMIAASQQIETFFPFRFLEP
jgi:4-hydroxybenzoate polyprenyltransferase